MSLPYLELEGLFKLQDQEIVINEEGFVPLKFDIGAWVDGSKVGEDVLASTVIILIRITTIKITMTTATILIFTLVLDTFAPVSSFFFSDTLYPPSGSSV